MTGKAQILPPRLLAVLLVGHALISSGCREHQPLARISGEVRFENERVEEGLIIFSNGQLGVHMTAEIANGKYEVVTSRQRGLPPGEYRVAIAPPIVDHPVGPILQPPQATAPPNIPRRYHKARTSGLTVNLIDGENEANFNMKRIDN